MSTFNYYVILFCFIIGMNGFNSRNIFSANARIIFHSSNDGRSIRLYSFRLRGGLADKNLPSAIDDLAVHAETPFYPSVFDDDDLESDDRPTAAANDRVMKSSTESQENDGDLGVFSGL